MVIGVSCGRPKQQDMQRKFNPLTDDQWEVIKHFFNWKRKREINLRDVCDAILWITRTGDNGETWIAASLIGRLSITTLINGKSKARSKK